MIPALERSGPSADVLEGLVTFAMLLGSGVLSAALAVGVRRQRGRFETLVAIQRSLEGEVPLPVALVRLRACLDARLDAQVGLAVRDGTRVAVAGAVEVVRRARRWPGCSTTGCPAVRGRYRRRDGPRRCFVTPLGAGGPTIGALAIERAGDIGPDERRALLTLWARIWAWRSRTRGWPRASGASATSWPRRSAAATERVMEIDRSKSEFVALASHELRTPLTALQGFSELLATRRFASGGDRTGIGAHHGDRDRAAGPHRQRLPRSDAPGARAGPAAAAPPGRRRRARQRRGRAAPSRTHHAPSSTCELDGPLPELDADPDALDRVVKNLIGNAVKYSPAGTRGAGRRARARAPSAVEITIEDQGPRHSAEADLPRVFEPVLPRGRMRPAAAGGLGLGLAVVKSLVEAHGGEIERRERGAARHPDDADSPRRSLTLRVGGV